MKLWIRMLVLVGWLVCVVPAVSHASIRSFEESPGHLLTQSRHSLRDSAGQPWQVILFRRDRQISLRLVGFPDRVRVSHDAPLKITVDTLRSAPRQLIAASEFLGQSAASLTTKANIGQYDLQAIAGALRGDRPLTLTISLEQETETLLIPAAVVVEWQKLFAPQPQ